MKAHDYIARGYSIDADGWIITLHDCPEAPECPVAIHSDTGQIHDLEYCPLDALPDVRDCDYSQDWDSRNINLSDKWGNPRKIIAELNTMYKRGQLRAEGAIHGIPHSSPLGAIFC